MKKIATILIAIAVVITPVAASARTASHKAGISHGRHAVHARRSINPAAQTQPALAQRRWRYGADPSYGPGTAQMLYFRSLGRCVMDEGYGRYTFCDVGR